MVPSHSLDWRPERAVVLCCFIQETVLTQIFEAFAVSLNLPDALMISCPVGLVKMRLPSCQLEDMNTASAWKISQPVLSNRTSGGSEMLWFPRAAGVGLQTGQVSSYGVSVPLKAVLLGYTAARWALVMLTLWHPHRADKYTMAEVTGQVGVLVKRLC